MTEVDNDTPDYGAVDIGRIFLETRESQDISLKEASQVIKLNINTISAIEKNDFSSIGASVYVRGYIGLYAKFLGLNAEELEKTYDFQYPSEKPKIIPTKGGGAYLSKSQRAKKRHSKTITSLIVIVFIVVAALAYVKLEPLLFDEGQSEQQTEIIETNGDAVISDTEISVPSTEPSVKEVSLANPMADVMKETELAEQLATDALEGQSQSEIEVGASLNTPEVRSIEEVESLPEADLLPAVDVSQPVRLRMTFSGDCWLRAVDANGDEIVTGSYGRDKILDISGLLPIKLSIGNIDAVKTTSIAGEMVDIKDYKARKGRMTYFIKL